MLLYAVLDEGPVLLSPEGDPHKSTTLYDGLELGVYTTFRSIRHNRFLDLEGQLSRIRTSMHRYGLAHELDTRRVCRALHEVCSAFPGRDMRVRIDVLTAAAVTLGANTNVLIALEPFQAPNPEKYLHGVGVVTTRALTRDDPLTKAAADVKAREALMHSHDKDIEDCLIVNQRDLVLEGTSSNFYTVSNAAIRTAGEGMLEGITRKIVLNLAARLGLEIHTSAVSVHALSEVSEAALSSSSRGLMPVVHINGEQVGTGRPGPVMTKLQRAYAAYVRRTARPAVRDAPMSGALVSTNQTWL